MTLVSPFKVKYPSKILLVGEYSIIDGGAALALPFNKYYGEWRKNGGETELNSFFTHLLSLAHSKDKLIRQAIDENWTFESTIPIGYGIGSSGALTAAAYDVFFEKNEVDLSALKKTLGSIESFFHGQSSGLDPLVSFTNQSLVVTKHSIEVLESFKIPHGFYILDSGKSRSAKSLINYFLEEKESAPFKKIMEDIQRLNTKLISSIKNNDPSSISTHFLELSHLQFAFFEKMIPDDIKSIWLKGLNTNDYYMKLCGAGGGGYFLAFSPHEKLDDSIQFEALKD